MSTSEIDRLELGRRPQAALHHENGLRPEHSAAVIAERAALAVSRAFLRSPAPRRRAQS